MHKRLLQLIHDNAKREQPLLNVVKNEETGIVTIYLYDVIDQYFGISASEFNKELMNYKGQTVHLRINSPGGDVFEAQAMATIIAQHGDVHAKIDGIAASAATRVATAAKTVEISDSAFYMIHNAWTFTYGNKHDLRSTAELLDKIDGSIINDYVKKTGKSIEQITQWMDEETWFSAQEAVDNGFVDTIYTGESADNALSKQWNLAAFEKAPKALTEKKPEPDPMIAQQQQIEANHRRLQLLEIT